MDNAKGLSIVVPFLNEHETLGFFCETIDNYAKESLFPIEIIFVDDGSTDKSVQIIKEYNFKCISSVKLLELSRNFGFHAAVRAGIKACSYDICTWFGADLQEPLEIIKIAHEKISSGSTEIVYFSKKTIEISRISRLFSRIYSSLMKKYAISTYSSEGTATVAFGRKVIDLLNENVEANSQVILQIMNMGFRYENVSLDYNARSAGGSKWTLSKKIKAFIDSFVAFSYMPIRLVSFMGIIIFIVGMVIGSITIINRFTNPNVQLGYSTLASILALGFGLTNISLGIIAEYIWRTLDASRSRPVYIIAKTYKVKG
ncbi:glycosyltransferase [Anaerovibrio lipolyticus]|uniref:glycosyltransferase n=1 Tax=Anaerovibrio lipolyticus TaxID=82374 RepID=UPI0004838E13|nr:glycosyltransferase [Anaerovibrio lipolyticus]